MRLKISVFDDSDRCLLLCIIDFGGQTTKCSPPPSPKQEKNNDNQKKCSIQENTELAFVNFLVFIEKRVPVV